MCIVIEQMWKWFFTILTYTEISEQTIKKIYPYIDKTELSLIKKCENEVNTTIIQ